MSREARHPITGSIMKIAGYGGVSNDHMTEVLRDAEVIEGNNLWDGSLTPASNRSGSISGVITDAFEVHTAQQVASGVYWSTEKLRNHYQGTGDIVVSFDYKGDMVCSVALGVSGQRTTSMTTSWQSYSALTNGNSISEIALYNTDETKAPVISIKNFMICTLENWQKSHDYEPFYVPVKDAMFRREEQALLSSKNLLRLNHDSGFSETKNGITFIYNSDGSITINGTNTYKVDGVNHSFAYGIIFTSELLNQYGQHRYILSGTPSDIPHNTYLYIHPGKNNGQWVSPVYNNRGNGVEFEYDGLTEVWCGIEILAGATVNVTFYPMIRLASDPDDTYVPYAMTNKELTDKVNHISDAQAKMAYAKWLSSSSSATTYTITCTNPYQNFFIIASAGGSNMSFYIVYNYTDTAIVNKEVDKTNQGVELTFTNINKYAFTIAVPGYIQLNIISTLSFTVS